MRYLLSLLFVIVGLLVNLSLSHIGVDVSSGTNEAGFKCFKDKKYSRAIIRCYQSTGEIDPNCKSSIDNAKKAGIETIDVYMFPCYSCGSPSHQVSSMVAYLADRKADLGFIWFDIEGAPGVYFSKNIDDNRKFITELLDAAKSTGYKIGVYTSASQWIPLVGNWDGAKSHSLWYANYDNVESFSDFSPFGGWEKPHMKQYNGNINECGLGVDKNYWE